MPKLWLGPRGLLITGGKLCHPLYPQLCGQILRVLAVIISQSGLFVRAVDVSRENSSEALSLAQAVLGACHLPYDRHYISGNYMMKARTDALKTMLKLGMSPERFGEYVSAAEGIHYAEVIKEIDADMKALGKEKIQAENSKLKPFLENMLKRK
jgi:hypothetical protein